MVHLVCDQLSVTNQLVTLSWSQVELIAKKMNWLIYKTK